MYLMGGPRQLLFFQCGPEMPKGWTPLQGNLFPGFFQRLEAAYVPQLLAPHRSGLCFSGCIFSKSDPLASVFKKNLFNFRERGGHGEREGQKRQCVVVPHLPPTSRNLVCNPVRNRTGDPLLYSLVFNPLSHTSQGFL